MASVEPLAKDDLRALIDDEVRRAGLINDGYAGLVRLQPRLLARMEALADRIDQAGRNPQPIKPEVIRQAIRSALIAERRRPWIIACVVCFVAGAALSGVGGYY